MGVRWVSRQDDICLQMACLRQLTICAHFIRNEQVAGSSPVTSSKEQSPSNRYNTWFEGVFVFDFHLYILLKTGLFCSLFCIHGCQDGCQNGSAITFIYFFYTY